MGHTRRAQGTRWRVAIVLLSGIFRLKNCCHNTWQAMITAKDIKVNGMWPTNLKEIPLTKAAIKFKCFSSILSANRHCTS